MITLEQAKNLSYDDILYHVENRNADGTPQRWRVNGRPQTWKTRPDEVKVPVKHGLRDHDYLTHADLHLVALTPEEAEEVRVNNQFPDGEFLEWVNENLEEA